ncbi:hypothetical protein KUTeg_002195 [Tegillarca granosa]|uniref:Nitrate/nitrite sensing protein domain-containing protein n=1 Tax=Tegillarca granosa TaxID=220873 RepID=A0ABQ9FY25_TEGGR|nr:hypothetical protein KUTeg_002195 [Tegillarca granosa]
METKIITCTILVIVTIINVHSKSNNLVKFDSVKQEIFLSLEKNKILHSTQKERGLSAFYLATNGSDLVHKALNQAYTETNTAISQLEIWPSFRQPVHFISKISYLETIVRFRYKVEQRITTLKEIINFYSNDNTILISWLGERISITTIGVIWKELAAYHMLMISKENIGIERALGTVHYMGGKITFT